MTLNFLARLQLVILRSPIRQAPRVSSRRRSAHRALLVGVCAFLAASAGLAVSLETTRPQWRAPEFGHRLALLRDCERRSSSRPLVLVVGTSRTQNAIFPGAMEFPDTPGSPRVFNFGQSASPPLKELLTLHRVLDAGIKPAAVLVELLPGTLIVNGPAEEQLGTQAARLSAADLRHLAPYCTNADALRTPWLNARLLPFSAQRQVLMNHLAPRWVPWNRRIEVQWESLDADGFQPVLEVSPTFRESAVEHARKEYSGAFAGFVPGAASVRAMRDLVGVCRANNIPVAFYIPPLSPAFRASFAPGVFAAGERYLNQLGRELGTPVLPGHLNTTEDEFMDGHHLLRHGAAKYSQWLAAEHLKPWLSSLRLGGSAP